MKHVALITGTSTGLGLELALLMAQQNWTVYASMRDTTKADPRLIESANINVVSLDVSQSTSVISCIETIVSAEGQLDLLVNNAGAGFVRTTEQATEEEVEWVLDVNFKGIVRTTKAVLPQMRAQNSGHIINIGSVGGLVGQPFNEIYCAAKFAVEGYTESMASYISPSFGIHFTVVEPGGIQSEFANSALRQFQDGGGMKADAYQSILENYIGNAQKRAATDGHAVYQTALEVAQVVAKIASLEQPPIRIRTSEWAEDLCKFKTQADPDGKRMQAEIFERFLK
ncbi:SDR family oxidoreductase [Alginatibacterium sediminis]|uniref:SDR family oxidoreductase n=1 Tax=Alginatibacterium sediminis TaxID=2164068 RepID=A0A420E5P8_9ALTE|nr:SDR family oxidoreductase [Alginatibacterium sediminis]RKF13182.1 SDR family oxidoreductase [Alginatibacterium sediminis]